MQLGSVNQGEKHLEVYKQFLSEMDDLLSIISALYSPFMSRMQ